MQKTERPCLRWLRLGKIGREKQSDPMRLVVQLPLNVTVTAQAEVRLTALRVLMEVFDDARQP